MIDVLSYAAKKTGKILMENFGRHVIVSQKDSPHNLLTEIDELAQETIIDSVLHYAKLKGLETRDIGFIGEEENKNSFKKHTFIIDPIDGTTNFISGIKYFGVSIAYVLDGIIHSAVVYEPYEETLYLAEVGKRSFKISGGQKTELHSQYIPISKCLLITNLSRYDVVRSKVLMLCDKKYHNFSGIRMYSSIALDLAHLTDRPYTVVVYGKGLLWDLAAAVLILKEAGLEIVDWEGNPLLLNFTDVNKHYSFIGANPKHIQNLVSIINNK